jgi:hypothetical protein
MFTADWSNPKLEVPKRLVAIGNATGLVACNFSIKVYPVTGVGAGNAPYFFVFFSSLSFYAFYLSTKFIPCTINLDSVATLFKSPLAAFSYFVTIRFVY